MLRLIDGAFAARLWLPWARSRFGSERRALPVRLFMEQRRAGYGSRLARAWPWAATSSPSCTLIDFGSVETTGKMLLEIWLFWVFVAVYLVHEFILMKNVFKEPEPSRAEGDRR